MSAGEKHRPLYEKLEERRLFAALLSNTTVSDSISVSGEIDTYEIQATAGQRLVISVGEGPAATSTFEPSLTLIAPDGGVVQQNTGANGATSAIIEVAVSSTGTFTLRVGEKSNNTTGDYLLHYVNLPESSSAPDAADGEGGALVSGTTATGAIATPGDFDVYSFAAVEGETIIASVGEGTTATPSFEPLVGLYGFDGELLSQNSGANGASSALVEVVAPRDGVYNLLVRDRDNQTTGDYQLHFSKLPDNRATPDPIDQQGGALTAATTVNAAIATPGDFDVYTITSAGDQRFLISMGEGAAAVSTFEPFLAAYGPNGDLVAQSTGANGSNSAILNVDATEPGVYNILVRERDNAATADYRLHFSPLPNSGTAPDPDDNQGGLIASNTTTVAAIATPGDFDLYIIQAQAGNRLIASIGEGSAAASAFEPYLALYSPAGQLVQQSSGANGATSAYVEAVAPISGLYNVLVRERDNAATGDYRLHFINAPSNNAQPDPADGEGKTLASNTTVTAAIATIGDLDLYNFTAATGDHVIISMGEGSAATSGFEPLLAVYGPDGALVQQDTGANGSNNAFIDLTITNDGNYNVLLRDRDNSATSDYRLHFIQLPYTGSPTDPADGDGSALAAQSIKNASIATAGDLDLYSIDAVAGEQLILSVTEGAAAGLFQPSLSLLGPDGKLVQQVFGSATANINVKALATGRYTVVVRDLNNASTGDYTLAYTPLANVVGRYVFYNNSFWDTTANPATNPVPSDDAAIAPDKQALLPREVASFSNYTSFSKGINGIMVDVAVVPGSALDTEDFVFHAGNTTNPATWAAAAPPSSIIVRKGAGVNGSDRVVLVWPDNTFRNTWLQVRIGANDQTNLTAPDVFYFGNLIGETGNSTTAAVEAADLVRTRNAIGSGGMTRENRIDFTRDGVINASDLVLVRNNIGRTLPIFTAPASLLASTQSTSTSTFSSVRISRKRDWEDFLPVV